MTSSPPARSTWLDRAMRLFAPVRGGEAAAALLLFSSVFLILCAYYVLKTVREGLILSGGMAGLRGDELKVYAAGAMAILLLGAIPAYGALANRVGRLRLLNVSYALVLACLAGFYVLGYAGAPIGLAFYVWLGIVNVFLIAQFWSYANDVFDEDQGKRLFALVAIGGSTGAIVGPRLTGLAGTYPLLVLAGALLAVAVAVLNLVDRLQMTRQRALPPASAPIGGPGGFALVVRDRYLLLIALTVLVANLVNTTGELVLSTIVTDHVAELVPDDSYPDLTGSSRTQAITSARRELIKAFYADFYFWVNVVSFLAQSFLVSRVIGRLGVRGALYVLPIIAFGAYAAIALVGGAGLVRMAKTAENATDYSLQNTVRHSLFLRTARAAKYKAKAAIDTFFVRVGDMLSAIVVAVAMHRLDLGARELALANLGLIVIWFALVRGIARRHAGGRPARATFVIGIAVFAMIGLSPDRADAAPPGAESGLVQPVDPGDSTSRRAARGALRVPRAIVAAIFWPVELGSYAVERYQVKQRVNRALFNDAETFGVVPTAKLESGFGVNVGARAVHRDLFGRRERLDLRAGAGGRFRQLHRASFSTGDRLGSLALVLAGVYERRPHDPLYVERDGSVMLHRYRRRVAQVSAAGELRATPDFTLRAAGALTDQEVTSADTLAAYGELELRFDTRRAARTWEPAASISAGTYAAAYVGHSTSLDEHPDFWRYGGDVQHFVRIGAGPRVIALRGHLEAVAGGGDAVAFHELPTLGGATFLRGHPSERFRDRVAAMASAEYRWDLSRTMLASVFVDTGRVDGELRELTSHTPHVGYGLGIELHTDRSLLARLSVASSPDGGVMLDLSLEPVFEIEPRERR